MGPRSPLLTSWFMFMFPPCQNALYQDRKERRTSNNCGRYTNQLHIANRKFDISVKETSTQTQRSVALRGRPEEEIRLINHNQEENHRGTFPGFRIPSSQKAISAPVSTGHLGLGKQRKMACSGLCSRARPSPQILRAKIPSIREKSERDGVHSDAPLFDSCGEANQ
jgi:DNA-directed RNA polymerase subunit M/transcription elongation factor TFIIS